MDPITPIQSASTLTGGANVQQAVSELGADVFLRLLVTQLQSQDPTNPTENGDFVAQLAQFTTLEQTTSTNELLEQLISQDTQRTEFGLVNLIGRNVMTAGDTVSLGSTDSPILSYALSGDASRVIIEVLGPNNQVLRALQSVAPEATGTHKVQWDGTDTNGDRMPEGVYQFRVKAINVSQQPVPVLTFARETVTNIVFGTENPVVLQSGKMLNTQDIISIQ